MVAHDQLLESRFYREFLSDIGIARVCTGFVLDNGAGIKATSCGVFRDKHDTPFNQGDVEWMKLLIPHLSRSLGMTQHLETVRLQTASILASFDRLAFGVVLLNYDLSAVHMNTRAKEILARRDALTLNAKGCLVNVPISARSSSHLARWLRNLQLPVVEQTSFTEVCRVQRHGGGSYDLRCSPLSTHEWQGTCQETRYVVFISDPDALQLPDEALLSTLYGLTRAQSRVALAFAHGGTYKGVAHSLGISEDTIRSHVKEIYPKVRVSRQADLVRLVLALGKNRA
jgi:DNA-binding CsgD family transcriptional regulator